MSMRLGANLAPSRRYGDFFATSTSGEPGRLNSVPERGRGGGGLSRTRMEESVDFFKPPPETRSKDMCKSG